jgi:HSP20 family molecular chaperone IbpA
MKKRSFFERLAGNLRFDDVDEDIDEVEVKRPVHKTIEKTEVKREVPIKSGTAEFATGPAVPVEPEEEVGELPVDVYETPHEIIIQTLIAGVLPEHLSINITRDVVTISGRREENRTITDEQYHYKELYWGAFERVVTLPAEVEIDSAEAIERHGMLMIKLPKIDKRRKTTLKIKSI